MYAIVEVGAKQYSVKKGDVIEVEKQLVEKGQGLTLDKVLMISDDERIEVGQPYVKEARVEAKVLNQFKGKNALSFKYKRRKSSHWSKGHRQQLTALEIQDIVC
jgi:large subunit ribosomal protein L21